MKINFEKVGTEEEKLFLKTVQEYSIKASKWNKEFYTNFYNYDWMQEVIYKYIGMQGISNCIFTGGYEGAERQMLGFVINSEYVYDTPAKILKVVVNTGIGKMLTHRDFLGAILNLGIERDKVGDILIKSFGAYIIVHEDIKEYIRWNLTKIGKYTKIEIEEIDESMLEIDLIMTKVISGTVSSLRADSIVSLGFGVSRTNSAKFLKADKGRANGLPLGASDLLKEGDVVALRGFGKMRLSSVNGKTKKDRIHVTLEKYI